MDIVRMFLVYPHLLACCVALGLVITSDAALLFQLFDANTTPAHDRKALEKLQRTVAWALVILWASGLALVSFDVATQGWKVLTNPKLQAKISIVVLLSINGYFLHTTILPALHKVSSLLSLPANRCTQAVLAGVISGVSWFYAAMLGIGRPLNYKYSLFEILAAYPLLILGGFAVMMSIVAWAFMLRQGSAGPMIGMKYSATIGK